MKDVPRDGNCMFSAIAHQLYHVGRTLIQLNEAEMRRQLVWYIRSRNISIVNETHRRKRRMVKHCKAILQSNATEW